MTGGRGRERETMLSVHTQETAPRGRGGARAYASLRAQQMLEVTRMRAMPPRARGDCEWCDSDGAIRMVQLRWYDSDGATRIVRLG